MAVTHWPRALSWSEFSEIASRPAGVKENAQISVTTDMTTNQVRVIREKDKIRLGDLEIPVVVDGTESWVVQGTKSDDLLSHEQGHFDIAGLVAWELYRGLMALRAATTSELQRQVNRKVGAARNKLEGLSGSATQEGKYDTETKHGTDAAAQKRWKDLIADCMTHDNRALPSP